MRKIFTLLVLLLMHVSAFAEEQKTIATFVNTLLDDPLMPLYILSAIISIVMILVLIVALYVIRVVHLMAAQAAEDKARKEGKVLKPQVSFWSNILNKLNAAVPVAQEQDIDLGHDFDGIRELDNHLPPWWTFLFIGTIIWGVVYFVLFHVTLTLPLSIEEYDTELVVAQQQADRRKASQPGAVIDENTLQYTADVAILENGKTIFASNCIACHRADGGGNTIGPNLTDKFWIHGGDIKNIFLTINKGKVDKGMPEWGKAMSILDVRDVAFFVMSLQGTNPADAKAPQGEKFVPGKIAPTSDSTTARASL